MGQRVAQVEGKRVIWLVHASACPCKPGTASLSANARMKSRSKLRKGDGPRQSLAPKDSLARLFDLESKEVLNEESVVPEPDPAIEETPPESSGYEPSIGEPEREVVVDD